MLFLKDVDIKKDIFKDHDLSLSPFKDQNDLNWMNITIQRRNVRRVIKEEKKKKGKNKISQKYESLGKRIIQSSKYDDDDDDGEDTEEEEQGLVVDGDIEYGVVQSSSDKVVEGVVNNVFGKQMIVKPLIIKNKTSKISQLSMIKKIGVDSKSIDGVDVDVNVDSSLKEDSIFVKEGSLVFLLFLYFL